MIQGTSFAIKCYMERHFKYRKQYLITFIHRTALGKFNIHVMVTWVSGKFPTLSFDVNKPKLLHISFKPRTQVNPVEDLTPFQLDSPQPIAGSVPSWFPLFLMVIMDIPSLPYPYPGGQLQKLSLMALLRCCSQETYINYVITNSLY